MIQLHCVHVGRCPTETYLVQWMYPSKKALYILKLENKAIRSPDQKKQCVERQSAGGQRTVDACLESIIRIPWGQRHGALCCWWGVMITPLLESLRDWANSVPGAGCQSPHWLLWGGSCCVCFCVNPVQECLTLPLKQRSKQNLCDWQSGTEPKQLITSSVVLCRLTSPQSLNFHGKFAFSSFEYLY